MRNVLYALLLLPFIMTAQSTEQNYIRTYTYRDSTTNSDASKARANVTYFDGLGRPIQKISGGMSNTGKDIITHMEYDNFGRQAREYLPYPSTGSTLGFDNGAPIAVINYYKDITKVQDTASNPYTEKFFEASPLNRILKQGAPGAPWKGHTGANNNDHTVKYAYLANNANEVYKLRAVASWNATLKIYDISLVNDGFYDANQLYKTITQDENKASVIYTGTVNASKNNTTEDFKNKEGQVVLKRTFFGATAYSTHYVYDQYGNLTYVLSPKAGTTTTQAILDNLCYQYKYDARNRLVEKKLPGKQWEYIMYDPLDRPIRSAPVLTPFGGSTANTADNGVLMTIYDAFGRVAITGWYPATINAANRTALQTSITTVLTAVRGSGTIDGVSIGYNNLTVPTGFKLLTVNYYDDYTWPGAPTLPTQVEGQNIRSKAKGLPTGSWTRVITAATPVDKEITYTLYDRRSRPVRTYVTNYLGGYTQTDTKLDFDATPLYAITRHKRLTGDTELSTREDFTYDAQDRLINHSHKINGLTQQPLAVNGYNELGQLITKNVGLNNGLDVNPPMQVVDYKYNIRGWLTDINNVNSLGSDLFAFKIAYNNVVDATMGILNFPPLYNGNISETYWRTSSDNVLRKYSYNYDKLNRLTGAYYQKPNATPAFTSSYNEEIGYDLNGNITSLFRYGGVDDANNPVVIDDLGYNYPVNSNQISSVQDYSNSPQGFKDVASASGVIEYAYDGNGNMISDLNKGITAITYNHLNLPVQVSFGATNKIVYLYNAAGIKLKKTATEGTNTVVVDYLDGGFQYKGGTLQFFPTTEGYVDVTTSATTGNRTFNYVYQYKDHLGNVRLSYSMSTGTGIRTVKIKEENHYYPFGLKHTNYNMTYLEYQEIEGNVVLYPPLSTTAKLTNNYKYNGKELQDELGLNLYDYGARNYDPALGRWMNIDPKAEESRRWSPYTYAYNNPMYFVDPDGMQGEDWFKNNLTGEATYIDGATQNTQVAGYTYMCQECAKYDMPAYEQPTSTTIEGDVLYQSDGTKVAMNQGITIGDPLGDGGKGNNGMAYGISAGATIGGGITLEAGLVHDFAEDNWGAYFTFKGNVGLGMGVSAGGSVITPTGGNDFLINDFNGEGYDISSGVSTPVGGYGYSYGGTATNNINGKPVAPTLPGNWGKGERGYTTGSGSVDVAAPSAKVSVGATYSKSKTWVWDF